MPKVLPSLGLVPATPFLRIAPLFVPCLLIPRRTAQARWQCAKLQFKHFKFNRYSPRTTSYK